MCSDSLVEGSTNVCSGKAYIPGRPVSMIEWYSCSDTLGDMCTLLGHSCVTFNFVSVCVRPVMCNVREDFEDISRSCSCSL